LDAGHRAVGLCNVAIGLQRFLARMLDAEPARVAVDQLGLNHLTWVRAVRLDGTDILPELLSERGNELADHVELPRELLERLGAVPSYYLHYFYFHDRVLDEQRTGTLRAAAVTGDRELVSKALLTHPLIGQVPQVDELTERLLSEGRAHLPQFEQAGAPA